MRVLLILALLSPALAAQEVQWSWSPVTEATNGDSLTPDGYRLYCSFGDFDTVETKYRVNLQPGEYSCKISAHYRGVESDLTDSYAITLQELTPKIPTNITVIIE